jgi:hypothetical protein
MDIKTATETPHSTLLHAKLEIRATTTRHLSLDFSSNTTNLTARNLK